MKVLRWIAGTIVALGVSAFAVFNLEPVKVIWSPLHEPATLPASIFGLAMLAIGFLLGGFVAWIAGGAGRAERRRQKKVIKALENALGTASENANRGNDAPPLPPDLRLPGY